MNQTSSNPCDWNGVSCSENGTRVSGVELSESYITGQMFNSFSFLSDLQYLDLSKNEINEVIPDDLKRCHNLVHLDLSDNRLEGELNLSGLTILEILDLSMDRISGEVQFSFPTFCNRLVVANLSGNNFGGRIDDRFDGGRNRQYLDLTSNNFVGGLWTGFVRLVDFSVAENNLCGKIAVCKFWTWQETISVVNFQGRCQIARIWLSFVGKQFYRTDSGINRVRFNS